MNIADSMKSVLKNKTHIFTDNWKEDLSQILREVSDDMSDMLRSGKSSMKNVKTLTLQEVADATADGFLILKVLPKRIKEGFHYFKEDLLNELEARATQKEKTLFSMKVIGALTTFTVGTVYGVRRGHLDFRISGLKRVNMFSRFLVGELIFKITRLLLLRFLNELENEVTKSEDASNIRYFKELLENREKDEQGHTEHGDPAIEIVENLKKFIMTGKRGIE